MPKAQPKPPRKALKAMTPLPNLSPKASWIFLADARANRAEGAAEPRNSFHPCAFGSGWRPGKREAGGKMFWLVRRVGDVLETLAGPRIQGD